MHFLRISSVGDERASDSQAFDAASIPGAKKICRTAWERLAKRNPFKATFVSLFQTNPLTGDTEILGVLAGQHNQKPTWRTHDVQP